METPTPQNSKPPGQSSPAGPQAGFSGSSDQSTPLNPFAADPGSSPKPGVYTTQFWMAIGAIAALFVLTLCGKVPGEFCTVAFVIIVAVYHWLRKETYAELTINPNDHLAGLVGEVLEHLPDATPREVADIITALKGGTGMAPAVAAAVVASPSIPSICAASTVNVSGAAETQPKPPSSGSGTSIPRIGLFAFCAAALLFGGCAGTTVREGGKTVFHSQANASLVDFQTTTSHLHMENVDHSTPTLAGGHSTARFIKASGDAVTGAILAAGSGGASAAAPAVAGKAAALGVPLFSNPLANPPATPAAPTPTPAALQAH